MGANYLVLALAVAAASLIAAVTAISVMHSRSGYDYRAAFALRDALARGYVNMPEGLSVMLEEKYFAVYSCIDGVDYVFPLRKVLIAFKASGSPGSPRNPFEEGLPTLWRVWGNGTHAGAISFIEVAEEGAVIIITYVVADVPRSTGCLAVTRATDVYVGYLFSQDFGSIAVDGAVIHAWRGYREVRLRKLKVVPCDS